MIDGSSTALDQLSIGGEGCSESNLPMIGQSSASYYQKKGGALGACRSQISLLNSRHHEYLNKMKAGSNPREVERFMAEVHNGVQTHATNSVNHSSMKIEVNDLESSRDK